MAQKKGCTPWWIEKGLPHPMSNPEARRKNSEARRGRIPSVIIPAGEKVYYRMLCETGSAECEISFRYHTH